LRSSSGEQIQNRPNQNSSYMQPKVGEGMLASMNGDGGDANNEIDSIEEQRNSSNWKLVLILANWISQPKTLILTLMILKVCLFVSFSSCFSNGCLKNNFKQSQKRDWISSRSRKKSNRFVPLYPSSSSFNFLFIFSIFSLSFYIHTECWPSWIQEKDWKWFTCSWSCFHRWLLATKTWKHNHSFIHSSFVILIIIIIFYIIDLTQAEDMVILYNKLGECDSILCKMEQLLDGFKTDLEELTTEIKTL